MTGDSQPVSLANCDQEPIHQLGFIQSHGALLAFDLSRRLTHISANAAELLPGVPSLGEVLSAAHLDANPEFHGLFDAMQSEAQGGEEIYPSNSEITLGDRVFDLVLHVHAGRLIAEFELRNVTPSELNHFALLAYRNMDKLKRQRDLDALLSETATAVRGLTGFDRVMAYRFHSDGSGEVVAEAKQEALASYLGQRYPASDIPSQARKLYTINTLRLIADIGVEPVALLTRDAAPLDQTFSVLRSVSPIHVEYLSNMGVQASMSISIVVNGELWGLIACHHLSPHRVPYAMRMSCDVLAQIVAVSVQSALTRADSGRLEEAANLRARMIGVMAHQDDLLNELSPFLREIKSLLGADACVLGMSTKHAVEGELGRDAALALLAWLNGQSEDFCCTDRIEKMAPALAPLLTPYFGLAAIRFDSLHSGWLVWLRVEQIKMVRWGGKPEKQIALGPSGPRLTPRGSFEAWEETVRGTCRPWETLDRTIATQLQAEMNRACIGRTVEIERARAQLLAVLGHDLRSPLQAISMAAQLMEYRQENTRVARQIHATTGRMERLIGQVLDMSRIQNGLGLGLMLVQTDLSILLRRLLEETELANPGLLLVHSLQPDVIGLLDPDRVMQMVSNLLSNARHHGRLGLPVFVFLAADEGVATIEVLNSAEPIPEDLVPALFNPLKRQSLGNPRNSSGLGLGLYIAHAIAKEHGGNLAYGYQVDQVAFTVELPLDGSGLPTTPT